MSKGNLMLKRKIMINLKTFIKSNAVLLIFSFFCIGVMIGLSGSFALILLSFFIGIYLGTRIQKGDLFKQLIHQVQEMIIGETSPTRLNKKRKRIK